MTFPSDRHSPKTIWILFSLCWLVALVLAFSVDRSVAEWVQRTTPLNKHARWVPVIKWAGTFYCSIVLAALLVWRHPRGWKVALPLLISGAAAGLLYGVIKWMVGRYRPIIRLAPFEFHPFARGLKGLLVAEHGLAFPSGHATLVFATAASLAIALPRWRWAFYAVATLVAVERVLENAHYVSDVVAGAGFGILAAHLIFYRFDRRRSAGYPVIVEATVSQS